MGDSLAIFEKSAPPHSGQGTQVEQARAIAEVRAAVMIAMDRPRHVPSAITEMREVCKITQLAERAFFRVQRGSQNVNGESIHLARELARCWGNIDYGVKELVRDDARRQSEMLAFAWDLQTNARSEITFIIPHERHTRNGSQQLRGTQEIYENNASFAGRRLREVIFGVLPVWFRAEAADICRHTLEHGGGKPMAQRVADLIAAFEKIGISRKQIEKKTGRKTEEFLPEDVANMGVVYKSITRGEVQRDEEFPPDEIDPPANADGFEAASAGKVETKAPATAKPDLLSAAASAEPSSASVASFLTSISTAKTDEQLTAIVNYAVHKTVSNKASPAEKSRINIAIAEARKRLMNVSAEDAEDNLDQIMRGAGAGMTDAG